MTTPMFERDRAVQECPFDVGRRADDETPAERQGRRQNADRQRSWRWTAIGPEDFAPLGYSPPICCWSWRRRKAASEAVGERSVGALNAVDDSRERRR